MATRNSSKGVETRKAILDAAEILFSQNGYAGTALRDIAAAAGVRQGLVHYHFGNKHEIFSATIDRNLTNLVTLIEQSFAAAQQTMNGKAAIEDIVAAFVMPFLTVAASPEHPLRHYVVMTSHLMSSYRTPELRPILQKLSAVSNLFEERIRILMPHAQDGDILAGIYLIEAALIFMVQDPGFLDDLTRDHHSTAGLQKLTAPTIRFFAAGLERLAAKPA